MLTRKLTAYSLGAFLLGFLLICSVRSGFGQEGAQQGAMANPNPTTASIANGEKTRIEGNVIKSESDQLLVRDTSGVETVVVVTGDTTTKPKHTSICPGTCVKVEGRGNCSGQLVAEEIKTHKNGCCPPPPACPAPNPCANAYHSY